jgi:hypothetical protein
VTPNAFDYDSTSTGAKKENLQEKRVNPANLENFPVFWPGCPLAAANLLPTAPDCGTVDG